MNEVEEDFEGEVQDLINKRQVYRDLVRSPGWDALEGLLCDQIVTREQAEANMDLVNEPNALHRMIELRAERRAFKLVMALPQAIINDITEEIRDESADEPE